MNIEDRRAKNKLKNQKKQDQREKLRVRSGPSKTMDKVENDRKQRGCESISRAELGSRLIEDCPFWYERAVVRLRLLKEWREIAKKASFQRDELIQMVKERNNTIIKLTEALKKHNDHFDRIYGPLPNHTSLWDLFKNDPKFVNDAGRFP